jgi:hypothetical protein
LAGTSLGAPDGGQRAQPPGNSPVTNLFSGMPPLLMLGLGVVMGAAVSFALGVVFWSVFA